MFCLPAVEKLEYNLAEFTKPDNLARTFHRPPYYQEVIGSPKCKKIAVSTLPAGCCLRNKPPRRAPALQWCFVVSQFESVGTSIAAVLFLASLAVPRRSRAGHHFQRRHRAKRFVCGVARFRFHRFGDHVDRRLHPWISFALHSGKKLPMKPALISSCRSTSP